VPGFQESELHTHPRSPRDANSKGDGCRAGNSRRSTNQMFPGPPAEWNGMMIAAVIDMASTKGPLLRKLLRGASNIGNTGGSPARLAAYS